MKDVATHQVVHYRTVTKQESDTIGGLPRN